MNSLQRQCVGCGMCSVACPVYRVVGRESLTARGKMHLLSSDLAENPSLNFQELFCRCLLCGACESVCPNNLPITDYIVKARAAFSPYHGRNGFYKAIARMVLSRPRLLEFLVRSGVGLRKLKALPADSGLRIKLGLLEKRPPAQDTYVKNKYFASRQSDSEIAYFPGCFARFLQPSIIEATAKLLVKSASGRMVAFAEQRCCGLAAWSTGSLEEAARLAEKNISVFAKTTGPILTSCASCSTYLQRYPQLFPAGTDMHVQALRFSERIYDFFEFFREIGTEKRFKASKNTRIYYHNPCHLRFTEKSIGKPGELINKVNGVSRVDTPGEALCCGHGGTFHLGYGELSSRIFQRVYNVVRKLNPDLILTGCSGCLMQWQAEMSSRGSNIKAIHPAVFLAACLPED